MSCRQGWGHGLHFRSLYDGFRPVVLQWDGLPCLHGLQAAHLVISAGVKTYEPVKSPARQISTAKDSRQLNLRIIGGVDAGASSREVTALPSGVESSRLSSPKHSRFFMWLPSNSQERTGDLTPEVANDLNRRYYRVVTGFNPGRSLVHAAQAQAARSR
jgi:hypothetical protein